MQMIALAEQAEGYIKSQQQKQARQGGPNTKSGLEHRQSKQKRIAEAKQKHVQ